MSEMNLPKIDKYYLSLTLVLVLMSILLVFSFRGVFSAFLTSVSFDPSVADTQIRVEQVKLDEAYSWAFNRQPVVLNTTGQ